MSWLETNDPSCTSRKTIPAIETVIESRRRDLGGFSVGRLLPSPARRLVGPFIFFDHMGPAQFAPGQGIDVRPHPHINLATVTYLFEGEIVHRDSLGSEQPIRPGAINWMTAGRGIVHSERTGRRASRKILRACTVCSSGSRCRGRTRKRSRSFATTPRDALPAHRSSSGAKVRVSGRHSVWRDIAGPDALAAFLRRCDHARRRRAAAARASTRSARSTSSRARSRAATSASTAARMVVFAPGATHDAAGRIRRASRAPRRRADRRRAAHLVELRLELEGAHRASEARLEGEPFSAGAR